MIHLDTSFLIRALQAGSRQERLLLSWLAGPEAVSISTIAWAEFLCGPVSGEVASAARDLLGDPAPIAGPHAERAAELFNATGRRRGSLGDCLVAAAALEAGARLATENPRDFERFAKSGLEIVG